MILANGGSWEVNVSDPDTHAALRDMARSIGGLESTVKTLVETWRNQEQAASSGRRVLHEKFDQLQSEVHRFSSLLADAVSDIAVMKPTVEAVEQAKQRAIGAGMLGKALWAIGGAMVAGGLWLLSHIK